MLSFVPAASGQNVGTGQGRNKDCGNMLMNWLKVVYYICISFVVMMSLVFFVSVFLLLNNE
ncbi:hypothetical protein CJE50_23415 [Salmonella enterica]|uniref:Uncharacterized protein n=1 Tax=Salmonella enterica subsp. enterica serovar Eastbourne TaxID=486993 RepID=A0A702BA65_SALET|nr:hypothetical protein [Salmonella enterica]ECA1898284.1 hypothetical protein [Salmonella enterica subsp. enterica serovar Eastbourne]HAC6678846.1 hypothetical protein [Salmonella enterica subsp. enterica serovar Eastbourne]HAE5116309.1 hypothetical protein [Salmonella enterica subsp. enterica serovar Eastbourne]